MTNKDIEENENAFCLNCIHSELIDRAYNIVNCKLLKHLHNGYCVCDNFEEVKE